MVVKLLNKGYKKDQRFYEDFLNDKLWDKGKDYISQEDSVILEDMPDFPIYLGRSDNTKKKEEFKEIIQVVTDHFLSLDREYILDEIFWHSYFCLYKREYLLEKYPEVKDDISKFNTIVTKNFNWENYTYKCILAAQYISDYANKDQNERYCDLIIDNLDVFNYIIKYDIFRNGQFLINLLDIIEETKTSSILKANIKDRCDLGKDPRYGRRVIYEFNKSYPIILAPMLSKDELKYYFLKFLKLYYKGIEKIEEMEEWSEGEQD